MSEVNEVRITEFKMLAHYRFLKDCTGVYEKPVFNLPFEVELNVDFNRGDYRVEPFRSAVDSLVNDRMLTLNDAITPKFTISDKGRLFATELEIEFGLVHPDEGETK